MEMGLTLCLGSGNFAGVCKEPLFLPGNAAPLGVLWAGLGGLLSPWKNLESPSLVYPLRHEFPSELIFNSEFNIFRSCPLPVGGIGAATGLAPTGHHSHHNFRGWQPPSCAVHSSVPSLPTPGSPPPQPRRVYSLKPTPNDSYVIRCILPSLANFLEKDYSCSVFGMIVQERVIISIILKP